MQEKLLNPVGQSSIPSPELLSQKQVGDVALAARHYRLKNETIILTQGLDRNGLSMSGLKGVAFDEGEQ